MARYITASTSSGASGFRPWESRLLGGMGKYVRQSFPIPYGTDPYGGMLQPASMVTGGLGFDFSSIPTWAWLALAGVGALMVFGGGGRRRRR